MNPADLRHRIFFEKNVAVSQDVVGAVDPVWEPAFDVPGGYAPAGTKEFPSPYKRNASATARFTIRYLPEVAAKPLTFAAAYRIKFSLEPSCGFRTFNIFPPEPDTKRTEILIEAVEVE